MRLSADHLEVQLDVGTFAAAVTGSGTYGLGPLEVTLTEGRWPTFGWTVANRGDTPVAVRSVALVFDVVDYTGALRMFRHGYQSWSPSGIATFDVDVDPSTVARFPFVQAVHHADQATVTLTDELRSEWFTLLAHDGPGTLLAGFDGGGWHDGTFRLRWAGDDSEVELWAEAFLGDAVLAPGARRELHGVVVDDRADVPASELLASWVTPVGHDLGARVDAPFQLGWCSWYQYFHDVTEHDIRENLSRASQFGFEVFQVDDGFQSAIGDWLTTNAKFPTGLDDLASSIDAAGFRPGLWLAPFLAAPDSRVATEHPEWLAMHVDVNGDRRPLYAWWNEPWGGGHDGFMYALDTSHPEVQEHLTSLAAQLVEIGFTYLKLDFTFAPSVDGVWADTSLTPAERVRAGFDAIRRGAGSDAFLLGCGVPLSHVVGVVDANRISQDVAPLWDLDGRDPIVAGYHDIEPATRNAYANTLARSFMHRKLWLNDPDCLMLRTERTDLSADAAHTWARAIGLSGGLALVSDDLSLLDDAARDVLAETVELGRASDNEAHKGVSPVVPELLDATVPTTITAAGHTLVTDVATGTSTFT